MTCCIGYKTDKALYFIADTAGTDEDHVQEIRKDPKVFIRDNILFGTAGSFRMRDVLMYNLKIPSLTKSDKSNVDLYVKKKLISAIRNIFIDEGVCIKTDESDQTCPGEILIGVQNKIYKVESDFQVGETAFSYNAIGSGSREALGALDMYSLLNDGKLPSKTVEVERLLNQAMLIASGRNATVNQWFNCEKLKIEE